MTPAGRLADIVSGAATVVALLVVLTDVSASASLVPSPQSAANNSTKRCKVPDPLEPKARPALAKLRQQTWNAISNLVRNFRGDSLFPKALLGTVTKVSVN